jgi:hypothetical protein
MQSILSGLRAKLKQAEMAPEAVWQPLPAQEGLALQALFFLFMPPLFRVLSRMTFTAQQMLFPRPQQTLMDATNSGRAR